MKTFLLTACAVLAAGTAQAQVKIAPAAPYVEATDSGDSANFDIIVTNRQAYAQTIDQIEVFYLDAAGKTLWERRIDGNGVAPAIETVPGRDLEAGASKMVFNPFPVQPPGRHAASVKVKIRLNSDDHEAETLEATAALKPAPELDLLLPLSGKVWVWDGHDLLSHHRRWDYTQPAIDGFGFHHNAMRYSYDLVLVDAEGRMVVGDDKVNENFVGWGAPLTAPADGVVVEVQNTVPDNRQFDPSVLATNINLVFGNYVVIKHADGLYSVLGHVKQGSVTVKAGDTVKQGQVVAAVGASGSAMFPHLHYQLQDGPTVDSEGVPHRFSGLTTLSGALDSGWIDSGDTVIAP
jgi:hypothetical protein